MHPIITAIMEKRGIVSPDEIQEYLAVRPRRHYDPNLMKGMKEGVAMVLDAVKKEQQITVYGDYDADGVTSTVIMLSILAEMGAKVNYYIPSRFDEGYGLNKHAIRALKERGTDLIITVDCGCNAVKEVAYAKDIGLSILVTDHHTCEEERPDTIVINPKQPGCAYPFKELAGCGVAYKLALALRDAADIDKKVTNDVLDMVAIGTIGDVMPLIDENRTLVKYGLAVLNQKRRPGLAALMERVKRNEGPMTSEDVSFQIVPNVNAAGRMAAASLGVRLFTAGVGETAELADRLTACNRERKATQESILEQCVALKETQIDPYLFPVIVADGAHEGITGIVAGRLREMFNKPIAIIVPGEEGIGKGTSRSMDRLDLFEILSSMDYLFIKFGGHRGACGFTIPMANIEELREGLEEAMEFLLEDDPDLLLPITETDCVVAPGELTMELAEDQELLEPCGKGNEKPVFSVPDVTVLDVIPLGQNGAHVKVLFGEAASPMTGILFNVDNEERELLIPGNTVDLTGSLAIHTWQQRRSLQFMIKGVS